jgi:hypothetical protein
MKRGSTRAPKKAVTIRRGSKSIYKCRLPGKKMKGKKGKKK